jgi:RNA polymerase sigma factor (sigma-70 family)
MTKVPWDGALRIYLRTQASTERTDAELLQRFANRNDEEAFAALLRRHGPMVLKVSQRVLHSAADAEDIFQATFLVLARTARAIRNHQSVASWLYGVAHRLAVRMKTQEARRRAHERAAAACSSGDSRAAVWHEVQEVLDHALAEVPDKYRSVLVLCYLEGRTHAETARQLGCPLATVRTRVARGRELLRQCLARHGLPLSSAGMVSLALANTVASTVPVQLVQATVAAALPFAAGQAAEAVGSARVASMVKEGMQTMFSLRMKTALVLLMFGLLACGMIISHQAAPCPPQAAAGPAAPDRAPVPRIVALATLIQDGKLQDQIVAIDPVIGTCKKLSDYGDGPRVSPDGQTVIFGRDGAIWNCDTGGSNNPGKIFEAEHVYRGPVWSQDGKYIYVSKINNELGGHIWRHETWRYDAGGRCPVRLKLTAGAAVQDVSPDGGLFLVRTRLVVTLRTSVVQVMKPDGTDARTVSETDGFHEPARFSPDGRSVAYCRNANEGSSAVVVGVDGKDRKKVFAEPGTYVYSCCWSPDGKQLAVAVSDLLPLPDGRLILLPVGKEEGNWRIELIDLDGGASKRLPLKATVVRFGGMDWRPAQR